MVLRLASWRSKKQTLLALSSAEAEYIAFSSTAQEAIWLRRLNSDLDNEKEQTRATLIYKDNQSAISLAQFHGRAKHIDIRSHFIRERVSDGTIELKYCRTGDMDSGLRLRSPQMKYPASGRISTTRASGCGLV